MMLLTKEKIMRELHDSVDYNNLNFEYVDPTNDVRCYEYMDCKGIFNAIKNDQVRFDEAPKKHDEFLYKLSNKKLVKKPPKKKAWLIILLDFTILEKKLLTFLKIMEKWSLMQPTNEKNKTEGKWLEILTRKQMLQRLPIALAQVKTGNNAESLLSEIRQILYYLYQSKQTTKKVYNSNIKSINI